MGCSSTNHRVGNEEQGRTHHSPGAWGVKKAGNVEPIPTKPKGKANQGSGCLYYNGTVRGNKSITSRNLTTPVSNKTSKFNIIELVDRTQPKVPPRDHEAQRSASLDRHPTSVCSDFCAWHRNGTSSFFFLRFLGSIPVTHRPN